MQKAPESARPSRPAETKSEEPPLAHLAELMEGLESVVQEETALVRAGRLREASCLAPRKSELSGRYFKAIEELKANSKRLARSPHDNSALMHRHDRLQAVLRSNLMVLATAHAVSEGILRRLSSDLARKACAPGYGATGRVSAATQTRRGQPLALSRTL